MSIKSVDDPEYTSAKTPDALVDLYNVYEAALPETSHDRVRLVNPVVMTANPVGVSGIATGVVPVSESEHPDNMQNNKTDETKTTILMVPPDFKLSLGGRIRFFNT